MNPFAERIEAANIFRAKDPAAPTFWESFFFSPGVRAIASYRVAHRHWVAGRRFLASWISARARRKTGVEIHPGATIGKRLFIDHGMGIVIGETAIIGDDVTLFHGVTLGGLGGTPGEKRHPTIGNRVLCGAGSTVLGNLNIGDDVKIGANAVVLTDVPANTTAVGTPARLIHHDRPKEIRLKA